MQSIQQIRDLYTEYVSNEMLRKVGLSFLILFAVIVAQLIIGAIVSVIDSIPVFNGLMELVGLIVALKFCKSTLFDSEKRANLIASIQNQIADFK